MTTKPYLFLDIDGVINPWPLRPAADGYVRPKKCPWGLSVHPDLLDALAELDVEIVWLTTWGKEANKWIGKIDKRFSTLPVLAEPPPRYNGGWTVDNKLQWDPGEAEWWKHVALLNAVDEGSIDLSRGFIWADDDLKMSHVAWTQHNGGLALPVNPAKGITDAELVQIERYIAARAVEVA